MKSILAKQPDGTIQLTITIPKDLVEETWKNVVDAYAKDATLPGFRKGKAPKNIVEEKLDKDIIREEVLKKLLPRTYIDAVAEHMLKPFVSPKIHVQKLEDGQNWEYSALTAEKPELDLGKYKEAIQKITVGSKIIVPGKEKKEVKPEELMDALVKNVTVTIPSLLIEQEVERLLAQMLDEVKRLGLTLDQYLAATKRTVEDLRKEYSQKAENDLKLELALQKIAETEKVEIDEKEIDEAITKAKNENERKNLQENRYLLANILRQQKTLDFLRNL